MLFCLVFEPHPALLIKLGSELRSFLAVLRGPYVVAGDLAQVLFENKRPYPHPNFPISLGGFSYTNYPERMKPCFLTEK